MATILAAESNIAGAMSVAGRTAGITATDGVAVRLKILPVETVAEADLEDKSDKTVTGITEAMSTETTKAGGAVVFSEEAIVVTAAVETMGEMANEAIKSTTSLLSVPCEPLALTPSLKLETPLLVMGAIFSLIFLTATETAGTGASDTAGGTVDAGLKLNVGSATAAVDGTLILVVAATTVEAAPAVNTALPNVNPASGFVVAAEAAIGKTKAGMDALKVGLKEIDEGTVVTVGTEKDALAEKDRFFARSVLKKVKKSHTHVHNLAVKSVNC